MAGEPRVTGSTWHAPRTLEEALAILSAEPGTIPFAGGTDLMVLMRLGALTAAPLLDIRGLSELRGISDDGGSLIIGALTTYTELAASPIVVSRYPLLAQAARVSGAWAVQNRGTLGGNIANASPAADTPPVLLVYAAEIELVSGRGKRWLSYSQFHVGYKATQREAGELISRVRLPHPQDARGFYRKVGTRSAQAISKVCLAALARWRDDRLDDVRIALGSVAPTVLEARRTADYLRGRRQVAIDRRTARALLEAEIAPIDDVRSTARYRRAVAGNLLEQFLDETRPS
jgi:CO/xanthine dehydrogenase FAD-binding subunit